MGAILVSGAYFAANAKPTPETQAASVTAIDAKGRQPITVKDSNNDGVEDWQEVFVTNTPPIVTESGEGWTPPETLTGTVGLNFFQEVLSAEAYQGIGRSREQILEDTVKKVSVHATDKIFSINDLIVRDDTSAESIRTYANSHAEAIIENGVPDLRDELTILREVLDGKTEPGLQELAIISQVYLNTRDAVLLIPVPKTLAKQHLDLINVYTALYSDIDAMTKALSDPMLTFVRMKRYQDDVNALNLALSNMYSGMKPFTASFKEDDKALLFLAFNPDLR